MINHGVIEIRPNPTIERRNAPIVGRPTERTETLDFKEWCLRHDKIANRYETLKEYLALMKEVKR